MATEFDTQFAASAFPGLLVKFGEPIGYFPSDGSGRRSIDAIVDRNPPAIFDASGNAVLPTVAIQVLNSYRTGISSKEVNIGTDEIELPLKIGDTEMKRFSLMTKTSEGGGVTSLALI